MAAQKKLLDDWRSQIASLDNPSVKREWIGKLQIDNPGFETIAKIVRERCGIYLPTSEKNRTLVATRMAPLMSKLGVSTYFDFIKRMKSFSPEEWKRFTSAITTNTTHFFREDKHFEILTKFIQEVRGRETLRVWCAAASSGQEPYSILITILEALNADRITRLKLLATDIDHAVLDYAAQGTYTEEQVRSVPPQILEKYFNVSTGVDSGNHVYDIPDWMQRLIRFAPLNLMDRPYRFQHKFDVIFCRNVLIYFSQTDASAIVSAMVDKLRPGGLLVLGHAEAGLARNLPVQTLGNATYKKDLS